jgi:hypothetical protein
MLETPLKRRRLLLSLLIALSSAAAVLRGIAFAIDPSLSTGMDFALGSSVFAIAAWAFWSDNSMVSGSLWKRPPESFATGPLRHPSDSGAITERIGPEGK